MQPPPWRHHLDWGLLLPEASSLALLPLRSCFEWSQKWPFLDTMSKWRRISWLDSIEKPRAHCCSDVSITRLPDPEECPVSSAIPPGTLRGRCFFSVDAVLKRIFSYEKKLYINEKKKLFSQNRKKKLFLKRKTKPFSSKEKQNFFLKRRKKTFCWEIFFLCVKQSFFFFKRKKV